VKNLLDILAIKECNTSRVTCGNCDKKSKEASYCFHCGGFWCDMCLYGHNILRSNKEHRVLSLKDFQDKDFEDVLKRPVFCQRELHEKEVLKFYCKVCKVPVCQTCAIVDHNKHDLEHLEITARALKNNISSKLDAAMEPSKTISSYIRELEEKSRPLEHCSRISKEKIQQTVESLILILRQKEQESIAEVENQTKKAQGHLRKQIDEFQDQLDKREQSISHIRSLVQRSTGADLVRSNASIDELFQGLQKAKLKDVTSILKWKSPVTVFWENQAISQMLQESRIGHFEETATEASQCSVEGFQGATSTAGLKTEIEVITRTSEGKQCYCPGDYIHVGIISPPDKKVSAEIKIVDNNNGRYVISFIPSQAGQHVLTIQVNGENIKEFLPICIKERTFTPLSLIGEGCFDNTNLKQPWGMAVNDSKEIFLTDLSNNRIIVLNEKGDFIKSFGQNQLDEPTGICIDNEGRVYVANRGNNKILLFSAKGEYVTAFYSGRSLSQPRGIALDAQGNIIVCDAGNECIKFISPEGNICKAIGRGWLDMPVGCLYYDDKIFVSDRDAHLIKVYNSNGRFLHEFGSYGGGDGELNEPTGLAVDKTGHLLVCSLGNHRVQVFTLDGRFVTNFGEKGKELGQMTGPSSVSVLNSGHIVICEFGNHRLQIFE